LAEFVIDGMPTVLPFHQAVVADEAFAPKDPSQPFTVHTRWIETEFVNDIAPYGGVVATSAESAGVRQSVVVEVGGKRLEVVLPGGLKFGGGGGTSKKKAPKRSGGGKAGAAASGDALTTPMQGTIVKIAVAEGQIVEAGELVVVLEAMKMEQPINAHKSGTITGLTATVGLTVTNGLVIAEIKD
jgi:acetyl-CoA/propionyl-CoA carboxylase biotin carboxyl carrier protein